MEIWQIWIIVALVLIIVEIFTSGFAVACFSLGCIFAAIGDLCDLNIKWQILLFAVGSFLAFILIRPFVLKLMAKRNKNKEVKTNADSLIGRTAVVEDSIEADGFGYVKIDGDTWKAHSEDGSAIAKGERVTILSYESIILTVKK